MLGIDSTELLLVAVVALIVVGPKDLPKLLRTVGQWVGRARGMARHFRSGIDAMIRESELEEMEAKWREENARIMREHPPGPPVAEEAPEPSPTRTEHLADVPVADAPTAPVSAAPTGER